MKIHKTKINILQIAPQRTATLLLTMSLLLAACTPTQPPPPPLPTEPPSTESAPTNTPENEPETAGEESLANTQWALESFGTVGAETSVVGESPITLEFSGDGHMGGNGGCNSYGGSYAAQGDVLAFGEIVSTLIACVDSALMEQEVQYLDALQTVSTYQVEGDRLTILYNDGQSALNYVRITTTPGSEQAPPTGTPKPEAGSGTSAAVSTGTSSNFMWYCYTCGGSQVWSFENGQASLVDLPIETSYFFGYAPATGRILYSTPLPALGAGPSQIAVSDLWTLDVASGQSEPVFSEQIVVEAEWAPDGEQIAYILATPTTYELRWRGLNGEDKLLASDVAFTFSVSPNGDKVAFTRESNYGLPGQPGLYVVDVASAEEQLVSNADRAGAGSIEDKPVWSPSGQFILLPTYGTPNQGGLLRIATDGSSVTPLQFDPALQEEGWYQAEPFSPFWVSDTQFIGTASLQGESPQIGGAVGLILYQLNNTLDTIIDGEVVAEGQLIGWDVPGESVWVQVGLEMQSIPLPAL